MLYTDSRCASRMALSVCPWRFRWLGLRVSARGFASDGIALLEPLAEFAARAASWPYVGPALVCKEGKNPRPPGLNRSSPMALLTSLFGYGQVRVFRYATPCDSPKRSISKSSPGGRLPEWTTLLQPAVVP